MSLSDSAQSGVRPAGQVQSSAQRGSGASANSRIMIASSSIRGVLEPVAFLRGADRKLARFSER